MFVIRGEIRSIGLIRRRSGKSGSTGRTDRTDRTGRTDRTDGTLFLFVHHHQFINNKEMRNLFFEGFAEKTLKGKGKKKGTKGSLFLFMQLMLSSWAELE